jgi:ferritin-like metal-binding protein YciE
MVDSGGSEWTVATLKEHYDQRLRDIDKALQAALAAAERASSKTEVAAEKRFELLNELRAGVATREQLEALEKIVDEVKDQMTRQQGRGAGLNAGWVYLLGALAAVGTIVSILLLFVR